MHERYDFYRIDIEYDLKVERFEKCFFTIKIFFCVKSLYKSKSGFFIKFLTYVSIFNLFYLFESKIIRKRNQKQRRKEYS